MNRNIFLLFGVTSWLACAAVAAAKPIKPLTDHPGNIFVAGEHVAIALPTGTPQWCLLDYDGRTLGEFHPQKDKTPLGRLPVGFYRLEPAGATNWISLAVLEPLHAPTPPTSPIGIDVAMAWFYGRERMDAVASLCALAGVNWVRDRLRWAEMEPERGQFSAPNKYDASAAAQTRAGLRVLQVMHLSPPWANPITKRFPLDLRDAYRFCETIARRWRGRVRAFEPWNEADIPMFGGHTGAEMASLQKAAYLGLKSGNPDLTACLNVFALHRTNQLADLYDNEAWPYFDTYNLHHYEPFERYPKLYADHRAVSAGRPLWVSECAVAVKWAGDEALKEPTDADLRVQAERLVKTFAWSSHEGSAATFYFMLPHYVEGQVQFGILRPNLTPRPAYVALAAVGRLLADARPLGRLASPDDAVRAFAFRARPDGREQDLLVAWSTNGAPVLSLPTVPAALFDHLGRKRAAAKQLTLSAAPVFALLPQHSIGQLHLLPPSQSPPRCPGTPSPVVFQALWPEDKIDLSRSAYRLPRERPVKVPFHAYNFSAQAVSGQLVVESTTGCDAAVSSDLAIAPMERKELTLTLNPNTAAAENLVRVRGDFGLAGKPVLSLRFIEGND